VSVTKAEYWESPSSPVAHVIGLAGALLAGKPYTPGENESIDLEEAETTTAAR
jgi:hypothetical protein